MPSSANGGWTNGSPSSWGAARPTAVAPAPAPYTSGPGLQPGVQQTQMQGVDMTQLGPAQQNWQDNKGVYNSPSFGETNTQGIVGQYSNPNNRPGLTNNSGDWYSQYSGAMPNIAAEPGFGAYFENAKNRAGESIAKQAAATGAYGASSAQDQTARAFADLEGQRALKEADYNLQRLGEQRQWQGLGGQLAGQADSRGDAASADAQRWAGLMSSLGIDASRLGLDRTNAGMDAANAAESAKRNRSQDYFMNQLLMGDRMSGLNTSIMGPALDNDLAMMENASSGGVAQGNAALANESANARATTDAAQTGLAAYDYFSKR